MRGIPTKERQKRIIFEQLEQPKHIVNHINNFHGNVTINYINSYIGIPNELILNTVRKGIQSNVPRNQLYIEIFKQIKNSPQSQNKNNILALVNTGESDDHVMAQIEVHNAIGDALDQINPQDSAKINQFINEDAKVITNLCKQTGMKMY